MPDSQVRPLRAFAESLRLDQVNLTERWMRAVFQDTELTEADRLTYEQLSDHIPAILEEICSALEEQDFDQVEPAIERNARKHGKLRWRQGYRIDELVRELDLFRQMLTGQIVQFSESRPFFTRRHEERARHFIDEAVSFVTLTSIREVVTERDRKIDDYTGRLERANHELTLKQRLVSDLYESRMQITRSVVHDLRNFLNVFSMALQLMSRAPAKVEAALALANRQAVDMKALVDELVEYSVVLGDTSHLAVEPLDLHDLFDDLVASCGPIIEAKGLRLTHTFDAALSTIVSNRLKLKQVALNLLTNAAKYTKVGQVELAMTADGDDHWRLRVSDTGVGIGPSDRERVFKEFERAAEEDVPGAGLGLAIVRELTRVLGGQIRFDSHEGEGTSFVIRFPVRLEAGE
ncbi:sensor histidine kinase [Paraburkholderia phenazinium]|jgi:signal transduction histidine kinase|uniref:histidine kinase n=1 Tax=Paraburkholderia phenazinium TaxID=60549 RepID=A0A1G8KCM9_9BURK|nr:sensor histidine kinase [Paraburkholderia phenazinium]SDI41177.1 signal transduction histidine kinase [Paraburkholderia phenazinium]